MWGYVMWGLRNSRRYHRRNLGGGGKDVGGGGGQMFLQYFFYLIYIYIHKVRQKMYTHFNERKLYVV